MSNRAINKGQTEGERKAYQRGYNNGSSRAWRAASHILEIAKAWRDRARDGYPIPARCSGCLYFTKEHPHHLYGRCSQDSIDGVYEGTIHAALRKWKPNPEPLVLIVNEGFGCINWRPKPIDPSSLDAAFDAALKE